MNMPKSTAGDGKQPMQRAAVAGGGLRCVLDAATGSIVELTHEQTGDAFVSAQTRPGGLEVYDELDRKWYSDLQGDSTVSNLRAGDGQVRLVKQFGGAPFALECCWRADDSGLRLEVDAALHPGAAMRSIRISLVLPVTPNLMSWAPSHPPASDVIAQPVRYCYLSDEPGKAHTGIPMLTLYHGGGGGLSIVMPLEVPKVQLNMGIEPADPTPWYVPEHVPRINAGAYVDAPDPPEPQALGEQPVIRFTEKHVGLRPGGRLHFALWLFGHEPDWRVSLGKLVQRYIDYFQPHPGARVFAAGTGVNPADIDESTLRLHDELGVTHAWFHGHFEFHGEFLTDEALSDPAYRWLCEPYPDRFRDLSVEQIRRQIGQLKAAGIGTFLYGFNMHCDPTIVDKRDLHADVARSEDGSIARAYHDQPVMFFSPDSPFGRQLLDQADRMTTTYPEIVGLALDNWNYTGIDFGHDDGITMLNNRPAANVNFSQQRMVEALSARMHGSGRFLITNKGRTIESMRGVDCVLTESHGPERYATFAYMNLLRNIVPAEYAAEADSAYAEGVLKYLLIWGGQMGRSERQGDAGQARAYQPLLALVCNRRWVFEPDPLDLPAGTEGQIFRIDDAAPANAAAVVVTAVRPEVSMRDGDFREGLCVRVRLSDAERLGLAEWLGVEKSADPPVPCRMKRHGRSIEIELPPVGSAGVLKLS